MGIGSMQRRHFDASLGRSVVSGDVMDAFENSHGKRRAAPRSGDRGHDASILVWYFKPATRALAQQASLTSHVGVIFLLLCGLSDMTFKRILALVANAM